jgi:peptidoglycan hydrolase CwlO-like protein
MKKKLFFLLLVTCCVLRVNSPLAQSPQEQYQAKQKEIEELEQKISELQTKERDLSSQIKLFNSQITLTGLRINQTQGEILLLEEEIATLSAKINRLDISLDQLSGILANRIAQTYKAGNLDSLVLFLSAEDFPRFLSRYKYLKVIQLHDRQLLLAMEETKTNYEGQKTLKERKQEQLAKLKRLLEAEKKTLAGQKKEKEYLLEVTLADEKRYQELLAAARAEQSAIEAAMRAGLAQLKNGTPVEQGKEIALIGNTGYPRCSTGPHLHFEVRQDGEAKNPAEYLTNTAVAYDPGPVGRMNFTGSWLWPVGEPTITQEYGMSYWARLGWYRGGPHTGIDITSENPVIRAPKAGTLYKGQSSCGGVGLNFVAIDHGGGLISWYWHVQ